MKIETKFNDGNPIYFIHEAKVLNSIVRGFKIERINGVMSTIYLCCKDKDEKSAFIRIKEEHGFPTKEALLKSL